MRFWMMLAAMGLAAACAPQSQTVQEGQEPAMTGDRAAPATPSAGSLPAPVEGDQTRTIGAEQAGQTIEVAVGERFAVALVGVPTAGYLWQVASLPPFLTRAGEGGGPTTPAQTRPGFTGGNHWEVTYFAATEAGEGQITLAQRRPWETNEPPSQTFTVTIRAR